MIGGPRWTHDRAALFPLLLVQEPLVHGVAELQRRQRAAELRDLLIAESEPQIQASLQLLQVLVRKALRPHHASPVQAPVSPLQPAAHVPLEEHAAAAPIPPPASLPPCAEFGGAALHLLPVAHRWRATQFAAMATATSLSLSLSTSGVTVWLRGQEWRGLFISERFGGWRVGTFL